MAKPIQKEGSRGGTIVGHTKSGMPIYQSKDREKIGKLAQGGASIGAGVGIGYYSGRKAAHLTMEAAKAENAAYDFTLKAGEHQSLGPLFQANVDKFKNAATESKKIAKGLEQGAFRIKNLGSVAAAALIGYGVEESLKASDKLDNSPKTRAAIATGAGGAAYFAIRTGYEHTLAQGGIKKALSAAVRHVLKK